MSAQPAGFWESKLAEDAGCLTDLVVDVDCGKIQITGQYGVRFRNRLRSITTHCTGAAGPGGLKKIPHSSRPGECERYLRESLVEEIPFLNRHLAHLDIRKRAVMQMDDLPKGI